MVTGSCASVRRPALVQMYMGHLGFQTCLIVSESCYLSSQSLSCNFHPNTRFATNTKLCMSMVSQWCHLYPPVGYDGVINAAHVF